MTMHDHSPERRKQEPKHHCLVGYDPASERAVYAFKIPSSKIGLLTRLVRFEPDDPQGYDSYKVEYSNVVRLLDSLGQDSKPPRKLDYFVEPWVPQEHERLLNGAIETFHARS